MPEKPLTLFSSESVVSTFTYTHPGDAMGTCDPKPCMLLSHYLSIGILIGKKP
jgi:hypothetical protein